MNVADMISEGNVNKPAHPQNIRRWAVQMQTHVAQRPIACERISRAAEGAKQQRTCTKHSNRHNHRRSLTANNHARKHAHPQEQRLPQTERLSHSPLCRSCSSCRPLPPSSRPPCCPRPPHPPQSPKTTTPCCCCCCCCVVSAARGRGSWSTCPPARATAWRRGRSRERIPRESPSRTTEGRQTTVDATTRGNVISGGRGW